MSLPRCCLIEYTSTTSIIIIIIISTYTHPISILRPSTTCVTLLSSFDTTGMMTAMTDCCALLRLSDVLRSRDAPRGACKHPPSLDALSVGSLRSSPSSQLIYNFLDLSQGGKA
ncbi:hypothetical protein GY45DRAFT_1034410 [Cubamyces sp. BRFM 1775]|nr:hypothetical protein GY45DRAFT_1034410 [Cubamyces sp. BRFM 1775]